MNFELITQQKIYDALSGISVPVYDNAPQGSNFPYVTIGEVSALEFDTDNTIGQSSVFTVHVWSRQQGRKETKEIQGEIYSALHLLQFAEAGYIFTENYFVSSDTFVETDGKTRHGVQTFKLTIEEE
tara:strand:- start:830 stop:1210 length:381 start_codon:yes stop_codon:yes gene_type:complete